MSWVFLVIAGLMEIGGVVSLKLSVGLKKLIPTFGLIVFMGLSLFCLSLSLQEIPISLAYGVWTGIGAAGSVLMGMLVFKESRDHRKLLLVLGIIVSIIGLKLIS
ncbi:multidrug efflux SMR transporter [Listeria sp. PSOL-1]|uniref:DMT family transporter n=1 Tax=Listeria sp. PSOL-1 TaxID=1844999 RepID=UPI0013CF5FCC|nr:multidrug efflux SMR transporter [Listeria sp. PSOL-1]